VRVPRPYNFHDGVLLMELVADANGDAAPRLNDVAFTAEEARAHHATLLKEVVRMLCAGVVHGDLSEFNILVGAAGPVIIDRRGGCRRKQQCQPHAGGINGATSAGCPQLQATQYGEIWALCWRGELFRRAVTAASAKRKQNNLRP
jgi:RIO kinase 1